VSAGTRVCDSSVANVLWNGGADHDADCSAHNSASHQRSNYVTDICANCSAYRRPNELTHGTTNPHANGKPHPRANICTNRGTDRFSNTFTIIPANNPWCSAKRGY